MNSPLEAQIRMKLFGYLRQETSLTSFQDWFIPIAWSIEQSGDPVAEDLVREIELRLAEYSNGHWTEGELRDQFTPFATVVFFPVERVPQYWTSSASATAAVPRATWEPVPAGT